jgi:hypothetical protein
LFALTKSRKADAYVHGFVQNCNVIATHHLIGRRDLPAMDTALARYEALRRA